MELKYYTIVNGVYHNNKNTVSGTFEQQYITMRLKEGRMYSDEILRKLPEISPLHPLYKEWEIRKESVTKLTDYFKKKRINTILEVGCGNGWLSKLLSDIKDITVVGMDINLCELEQAARVFRKDDLFFVYDVFSKEFPSDIPFDAIIFSASISYFYSLENVLDIALNKLSERGEIHIIDTFFYKSEAERNTAAKRTKKYYEGLGVPLMADYYFHHSFHDLEGYQYTILYEPGGFINRIKGRKSPFQWITINRKPSACAGWLK